MTDATGVKFKRGVGQLFGAVTGTFVDEEWFKLSSYVRFEEVMADGSIRVWVAKHGDKFNGASIPRVFWTLVGSPFRGRYRRAAAIHDVYCVSKERSYQDTHAMFKKVMDVDGVKGWRANLMGWTVEKFGPRW